MQSLRSHKKECSIKKIVNILLPNNICQKFFTKRFLKHETWNCEYEIAGAFIPIWLFVIALQASSTCCYFSFHSSLTPCLLPLWRHKTPIKGDIVRNPWGKIEQQQQKSHFLPEKLRKRKLLHYKGTWITFKTKWKELYRIIALFPYGRHIAPVKLWWSPWSKWISFKCKKANIYILFCKERFPSSTILSLL